MSGADGDGVAAVASFQPFFPGLRTARPLNLAIVIDCSGSMQGDSIAQAGRAVDGMLAALKPDDRVSVVAFGDTTRALADQLLPCNQTNLAKASAFAKQLQADMGGTQIGAALATTYAALHGVEAADIFLVTDGEVGAWQPVVDAAHGHGLRFLREPQIGANESRSPYCGLVMAEPHRSSREARCRRADGIPGLFPKALCCSPE